MSDKTPSIQDLTKLTAFFGRISEVHIRNLKSFPFIFFNGVSEVKLEHDLSTVKGGISTISYGLSLNKDISLISNNCPEKRYTALEDAVRSLFWKEVKVKISINGEEVYKSE